MAFGLAALAIGRYPSMKVHLPQRRWRFSSGRVLFGVLQGLVGATLGFHAAGGGLAIALAMYAAALYLGGRAWDRQAPRQVIPAARERRRPDRYPRRCVRRIPATQVYTNQGSKRPGRKSAQKGTTHMATPTQLATGLAGAVGCDFRRTLNQLVFVEFGGKLSRLNLFRSATVVNSGTIVLKGTFTFDLDTGVEGGVGPGNDIWWDQQTTVLRQMVPQSTARIINIGVVDFNAVTAATLQSLTYTATPIRRQQQRQQQAGGR